ncbi:MAG: histidine phosphatase family protein [Actinomycetota bacterium]|nr:histidine phosphatase family protein [Actinomycetota bacterium]
MDLYVVRHAVAHQHDEDRWPDDSKRPLTQWGEERFRRAAGGIIRLVPEFGLVLSSPFARAWRTAEILEQAGWPAPISCESWSPVTCRTRSWPL